ncbi:hypothetical protein GCM10007884_30860 [Methylobacterium brachythecii]|uniref:Uncharacterized protein n=1 Tax=Methylobacterium brachythecii TaxID=1176177 RepID=A0ABQ6D4S4_9HYPH|nr:hypothetical protein GCM10007884_30860 [Methylobacterium brachythecii]
MLRHPRRPRDFVRRDWGEAAKDQRARGNQPGNARHVGSPAIPFGSAYPAGKHRAIGGAVRLACAILASLPSLPSHPEAKGPAWGGTIDGLTESGRARLQEANNAVRVGGRGGGE